MYIVNKLDIYFSIYALSFKTDKLFLNILKDKTIFNTRLKFKLRINRLFLGTIFDIFLILF